MENKDINIAEYLEGIVNNTYLTEIVEEYDNNKTANNFKTLCEVLSYRNLYLGMNIVLLDKKNAKKFKKDNKIDISLLQEDMVINEYIKYEGLSGENKKIFLAVYTEPKKVLLSDSQVNTIVNTDFNKMMDEILCKEECDGIIINPSDQSIIIEKQYLQLIYNKKFDILHKISRMFEITERIKVLDEEEENVEFDILMEELCSLLQEFQK